MSNLDQLSASREALAAAARAFDDLHAFVRDTLPTSSSDQAVHERVARIERSGQLAQELRDRLDAVRSALQTGSDTALQGPHPLPEIQRDLTGPTLPHTDSELFRTLITCLQDIRSLRVAHAEAFLSPYRSDIPDQLPSPSVSGGSGAQDLPAHMATRDHL